MYIPSSFHMNEPDAKSFIRENGFGILVSSDGLEPAASHVPFLFNDDGDRPILTGHLAKANPHWHALDGVDVLVIFPGPHAYVSPSWYAETPAVPTWNYMAVHVKGHSHIIRDEDRLRHILYEMVRYYEPSSPILDHLDETFYRQMARAVVGFEIMVTKIEGKAKLSQNRSSDDVAGVINALTRSPNCADRQMAQIMTRLHQGR